MLRSGGRFAADRFRQRRWGFILAQTLTLKNIASWRDAGRFPLDDMCRYTTIWSNLQRRKTSG